MNKRTFASVTEVPCTCGALQRDALDPDSPVKFDHTLNEFSIQIPDANGRESSMMIYHCYFCGGTAPDSIRDSLFAKVPRAEEARLLQMFADVITIEDALASLGSPEEDRARGVGIEQPERDGRPPSKQWFRSIVYTHLSEVANVRVTDYNKARVHVSVEAKFVGATDV